MPVPKCLVNNLGKGVVVVVRGVTFPWGGMASIFQFQLGKEPKISKNYLLSFWQASNWSRGWRKCHQPNFGLSALSPVPSGQHLAFSPKIHQCYEILPLALKPSDFPWWFPSISCITLITCGISWFLGIQSPAACRSLLCHHMSKINRLALSFR